jgi:hypothetical protein
MRKSAAWIPMGLLSLFLVSTSPAIPADRDLDCETAEGKIAPAAYGIGYLVAARHYCNGLFALVAPPDFEATPQERDVQTRRAIDQMAVGSRSMGFEGILLNLPVAKQIDLLEQHVGRLKQLERAPDNLSDKEDARSLKALVRKLEDEARAKIRQLKG